MTKCVMCGKPARFNHDDDNRFIMFAEAWEESDIDEDGNVYDHLHVEDADTCIEVDFICSKCNASLPTILAEIEQLKQPVDTTSLDDLKAEKNNLMGKDTIDHLQFARLDLLIALEEIKRGELGKAQANVYSAFNGLDKVLKGDGR